MRRGLEAMFRPNTSASFASTQCTSDDTCWCMEEEFPPIPDSYDTDECLTPEQVEQLRLEETIVETYWDKYGEVMKGDES